MGDAPKNYRARRYSVKWLYCEENGTARPDLGWFYEVKRGQNNIRILPADLDQFNGLLTQAGMQPVGPDWTYKVPVSRVTDRTEVPKTLLPSVAAATTLLPQSAQKRLAKLIFDYLTGRFPNVGRYSIRSDQGGYWGAAKATPSRIGTGLYTGDGEKGRSTWMARPDVALLELSTKRIPYIVEVEAGKHIKPKVPAGLIGACDMCKWHYPPYSTTDKFDLTGAILFVVLCSEALSIPASKKAKQLLEFEKHFDVKPGCLNKWIICAGADVDAAFGEFKRKFEQYCPMTLTSANSDPSPEI